MYSDQSIKAMAKKLGIKIWILEPVRDAEYIKNRNCINRSSSTGSIADGDGAITLGIYSDPERRMAIFWLLVGRMHITKAEFMSPICGTVGGGGYAFSSVDDLEWTYHLMEIGTKSWHFGKTIAATFGCFFTTKMHMYALRNLWRKRWGSLSPERIKELGHFGRLKLTLKQLNTMRSLF